MTLPVVRRVFASLPAPVVLAAFAVAALVASFHGAQASKGFSILYAFCRQTACADGATPEGGLTADRAGNLYGTTYYGGTSGYGTAFEVAPDGTETVLYSFCTQPKCRDGAFPEAPLLERDGSLYGTTTSGGANKKGAVFKISSAGTQTILYSFCSQPNCADGARPRAGVVMDKVGNLYGTTNRGGNTNCSKGCGTVFELAPGGTETVLYSFCSESNCTDGARPRAPLTPSAGNLYGTTDSGGAANKGAVFRISSGGTETVLYSFCTQQNCADGAQPAAGVVMDNAGNLYGTTSRGGDTNCPHGCGTVFELAANGSETVLYAFCPKGNCSGGAQPGSGALLDVGNGKSLYGTTGAGGANGFGTVFKLSGGTPMVLYSFGNEDGSPSAGVIMVKGYLYGTTFGSSYQNDFGEVFKLGTAGSRTR